MTDPNVVWGIAVAVVGMVGYVHGWRSHPKHRKGCNECDAVVRREHEQQVELRHDVTHKGYGFKPGAPDVADCGNPTCPRNRYNRG